VERPRLVVRFAGLMHRRGRTFGPAFGRRRLWRHPQPDRATTEPGAEMRAVLSLGVALIRKSMVGGQAVAPGGA
jgi:hypothetical protein